MKPNKILIKALNDVAFDLECSLWTDLNYSWGSPIKCNCGLLARKLYEFNTNLSWLESYEEMKQLIWDEQIGQWSIAAEKSYCPDTGLPLTEVFKLLTSYGLEQKDFIDIEYIGLADDRLSADQNMEDGRVCEPSEIAAYMREKARELKKELN